MSDNCSCGHDHDHDEEMEMEVITLTLDDDSELECAVLGIFDVDGKNYIALLPIVDEDEEEDEAVLIYEYFEEGEDLRLENIEDDAVFEKVSEAFEKFASEWEDEE